MHKKILEAALFTSSRPLTIKELSEITGISSLGSLKSMLKELKKEYDDRGLEIIETPSGEWHMQVKREILPKVAHLTPYSDLSEGCKRTLALVVYKEPVSQSEIIKIQGNKAYGYIKELEKRGLVKTYKKGRTKMIELTQEFEHYFGEEKEKIKRMMEEKLGPVRRDKGKTPTQTTEIREEKPAPGEQEEKQEMDFVERLQRIESMVKESAETTIKESELEGLTEAPVENVESKSAEETKKPTEEKKKPKHKETKKSEAKKTQNKKKTTGKVLVWTRNSIK